MYFFKNIVKFLVDYAIESDLTSIICAKTSTIMSGGLA